VEGNIEFDHVRFGYSEDKILITDMNANIAKGQKVGICGPTGAGKTTLVNLLMRFYDISGGSIRIDGIDTRDMSRQNVRRLFGMVLQDTWLYSASIRDNIRYGRPDATDEEVEEALQYGQSDDFISTLPEGYDTMIDEWQATFRPAKTVADHSARLLRHPQKLKWTKRQAPWIPDRKADSRSYAAALRRGAPISR
jgi:ATP-binding cassette subfamily B protein